MTAKKPVPPPPPSISTPSWRNPFALHSPVPVKQLAYYGGLAGLAAIGILEWPIVGVISVGHWLLSQKNDIAKEIGEAIEDSE